MPNFCWVCRLLRFLQKCRFTVVKNYRHSLFVVADYEQRGGLEWIWITPKERKKGHLATRWINFRKQFGDFVVESPVSDGMKGFLKKQNEYIFLNYPE